MLRCVLSLMYRVRVALLLGAVVCLSAGRAEACGEAFFKVAYANPTGAEPSMAPMPVTHSAPTTPSAPTDAPCHGPNCSKAPAQPPVPGSTTTISSPNVKEIARCAVPDANEWEPRGRFDRTDTSAHPISATTSVFHPPRRG